MFNIGDKVLVPNASLEGVIKSKFSASGKEFVELKGHPQAFEITELVGKFEPQEVVQENAMPISTEGMPLDIAIPVAQEEYDYNKDDRDEEFKQQILKDVEAQESEDEEEYFTISKKDFFTAISHLTEVHNLLQSARAYNENK